MGRTAIFTDDLFLEHDTGPGHPECARRLAAIRERLEKAEYFRNFIKLPQRFAGTKELAAVHSVDHISSVRDFCARTGGGYLDGDTPVSAQSFHAAELAAGCGLEAADHMHAGAIDRALLLVRPPGHHSLRSRAMGFCLFNNVAVCARYLQKIGYSRVAIVDWDVHHGNGTEAAFYDDGTVLFISLHQYPFYPGTGAAEDTGTGPGTGYTLNIPMRAGSGDTEYQIAVAEQVIPKLERFRPDVILISAGFDAHASDPLAQIQLQTSSYEWMTRSIRGAADRLCHGRIISFLEGGYDLRALADSVETHAAALL